MATEQRSEVHRSGGQRLQRRRRALAAIAVGVLATAAACSSEPTDPAEARRDRVQDRLESTFSRQQSDCILEQLDDDQLGVLDPRTEATDEPGGDLDDPELLEAYSNAAVACVVGFNATTG